MTMSTLILTLAQPALLAWLLKATTLLILALAMTTVLRRSSAGTRHLVWLATLAGILFLPAVSLWTPIRLAIVPAALMPSLRPVTPVEQTVTPSPATAAVSPSTSAAPHTPGPSDAARSTANGLSATRPFPLWTTLLAVWGSVALGLLGWLGFGALSVRRIVRSGHELDDRAWTAPLCEIADRLDLDAVPRLLSSPLVEMPFACGIAEPTIVLPASSEGWSDSRRRAVLFHELAHVRRRDLVGHTLGRVTCALYWFHPLVWTAARRLRAESERACDDLVLSCGARASDYADHLLDIVISVRRYGAPATAMPMARRRELEGRVLAILDPAVARIGPGRIQSATLLAGLGALALSIGAVAPVRRVARAATSAPREASHAAILGRIAPAPTIPNEPHRAVASAIRPQTPTSNVSPAPTPNVSIAASPQAVPTPNPRQASITNSTTQSTVESMTFGEAIGTLTKTAVQTVASSLLTSVGGNSKNGRQGVDSAKVVLLLKVLRTDPDASVRRMAAWGLNEAGDALGATDALAEALRRDDDEDVREMAAWALSDARRTSVRRALASAVGRDPSERVRETAAWALGYAGVRDEEREVLEAALTSDESAGVRETAAWGLGYSPRRPAARALVTALSDRSPEVRETAAWALAETEDDDAASAVESAFARETSAGVRMAELRALTFMHVESKEILDVALASKDPELRARAVRMIAGSPGAWPEPRPRPRPRPMP
jgi:beta-lactamase regulating signal transducer with metallopeptidase domain/HEAT repeat protein